MDRDLNGHADLRALRRKTLLGLVLWTLVVAVSLGLAVQAQWDLARRFAETEARSHFDKDVTLRLWATRHGGFYVPVDESTLPSPWLSHVPERDVVTPSGRVLTLMNPAYALRQMTEEYGALYGVRGHITSLKPLRPENRADPWETQALAAFERGAGEVSEIVEQDGRRMLRLMRVMKTEPGCLKCHGHQGYQVGDVRGGVGVSVSVDKYDDAARDSIRTLSLTHGATWAAGCAAFLAGWRNGHSRTLARLRAENEVRRVTRHYATLLEAAGEGIFGLDQAGRVTFVNPAFSALTGFVAADVVGEDHHDLVHHSGPGHSLRPRDDCPILATAARSLPCRGTDEWFRRKDGSIFPVEFTATPLDSGGAVVVFRNIEDRHAAEKAMAEKAAELERSNRELEQFAYVASHDLQEPLRMVASYLALVERRYSDRLDQDGHDFIGFAVDGAKRMQALIQDLLRYSRMSRCDLSLAPVAAERAVRAALDNLTVAIDNRHAVVTVAPLPVVLADEPQLTSLFQNLVGNALKYCPPERSPHITITAGSQGGTCTFAVADNGIGIAEADRERIFQIFQRLHPRGEYEGSGIGLAICKRIAERHGGRIWVESAENGEGSVFRFTLRSVSPSGKTS